MATVNLSWSVEGLHDGIRVERSFTNFNGETHTDYLDTLPAGTTEFEDEFSIFELTEHLEVPPEDTLDLLVYTLTTFRGDKQKSTTVPVPIVDTDPEWIQNIIDNICGTSLPLTVENDVLNDGYAGILLRDSFNVYASNSNTLSLYVSKEGYAPQLHRAVLQYLSGGDHRESDYYFPSDFDYTLLHDVDFTRLLNQGLNYSDVETPCILPIDDEMFAGNSYVTSFALPSSDEVLSGNSMDGPKYDAINDTLYDQLPTREVDVLYFLSAPFVASSGNHSLTGMSIWVMDSTDDALESKLVPWDPTMLGMYVYCVSINTVNGIPEPA